MPAFKVTSITRIIQHNCQSPNTQIYTHICKWFQEAGVDAKNVITIIPPVIIHKPYDCRKYNFLSVDVNFGFYRLL